MIHVHKAYLILKLIAPVIKRGVPDQIALLINHLLRFVDFCHQVSIGFQYSLKHLPLLYSFISVLVRKKAYARVENFSSSTAHKDLNLLILHFIFAFYAEKGFHQSFVTRASCLNFSFVQPRFALYLLNLRTESAK